MMRSLPSLRRMFYEYSYGKFLPEMSTLDFWLKAIKGIVIEDFCGKRVPRSTRSECKDSWFPVVKVSSSHPTINYDTRWLVVKPFLLSLVSGLWSLVCSLGENCSTKPHMILLILSMSTHQAIATRHAMIIDEIGVNGQAISLDFQCSHPESIR